MYKIDPKSRIGLETEIAAVVDYVPKRWEGLQNPDQLVRMIARAAQSSMLGWYDQNLASDYLHALRDERKAALNEVAAQHPELLASSFNYYDNLSNWLCALERVVPMLSDAMQAPWNFEHVTNKEHWSLASRFSWLDACRPMGWEVLKKGYVDYAGQAEYDSAPDYKEFKGADTSGFSSFDFTARIALPYVMYDEECQDRPAPRVLTSSIFAHFAAIVRHNQTLDLIETLKKALGPLDIPQMLFDVQPSSSDPVVSVLLDWACKEDGHHWSSKADWDTHVLEMHQVVKHIELSAEELDKRKADTAAMLKELFVEISSEDEAARSLARRETATHYRELLLSRAIAR